MSEQVQLWETYNDKGFKAKLSEFAEKDAAGNDIATSLGNRYTKGETDNLLNGKEDKIDDLDTIRSNASKGATAIQGVQRNGTDLTPDANSKVNVEVPVLGIQVNNADVTPDQSTKKVNLTVLDTISAGSDYPVSSKVISEALDNIYTKEETNSLLDDKVDKEPGKRLSTEDYTSAEKDKLGGIDEGAQVNVIEAIVVDGVPQPISGKTVNMSIGSQVLPSDINPAMDGTATPGTALTYSRGDHVHPSDTSKADKVSGAEDGNFAGLDANGNLVDSNRGPDDFATAEQGNKADSAYQLPTGGIPGTDLDSSVRTSLALADTAVQPAALEDYVQKETGKGLSTEDYTTAEKTKLADIEAGAEENVQADWGETESTSDAYIKNKPTIPAAQIQSDWGQADSSAVDFIKNKPEQLAIVGGTGITVTEDQASNELVIASTVDTSGKADKVTGATDGNFAGLDPSGNLTDSGSKAADFATADQGARADTAIQGVSVDGTALAPVSGVVDIDLSGKVDVIPGKGLSTNDYTNADKGVVDKASAVIPPDANADNKLVSTSTMQAAIANFGGFEVVPLNPDTHEPDVQGTISDKIIYLTKESGSSKTDPYTEWIYQNSSWEIIGETSVDLNGYIKSVSMAGGSAISPVSGATTIDLPAAANSSGTGTAGIMSGADKVKLDGIADGAEVNAIASISLNGTKLPPDANRNVEITVTSPSPSDAIPEMDGTADAGVSDDYSRADHVHPSDSNKADKVTGATSGNFAGLGADGNLVDSGSKAADFATAAQGTLAETAYQKPSTGIPSTDLEQAAQDSLALADTAYQKPSTGIPSTDLEQAAQDSLALADTAYQKPSTGIPSTDLDQASQTSLGLADTAVQDANYVHTDNNYTAAEKDKLANIEAGAQVNVQADWEETDSSADSYIQNKPAIPAAQIQSDWNQADTAALDYIKNKPASVSMVAGTGISITEDQVAGTMTITSTVDTSTKADKVSGATDGNFAGLDTYGNLTDSGSKAADFATAAQGALADTAVQDASYVHTDNNYTTAEKTKLSGIEDGAQVNVQSDWTETDTTADSYIKHKPAISNLVAGSNISIQETASGVEISATVPAQQQANWTETDSTAVSYIQNKPQNLVQDASYVHTDNNYTTAEQTKLAGIATGAEVNVQANWTESDTTADSYIQNKPNLAAVATSGSYNDLTDVPTPMSLVEGQGIDIQEASGQFTISTSFDPAGKADKVSSATNGHLAGLDANGNLTDSGSAAVDFAPANVVPSDATAQNQLVSESTLQSELANFGGFKKVPGDASGEPALPSGETPSTKIIYLTKDTSVVGSDQYREWIWDEGDSQATPPVAAHWELIGDTSMNLNGYVQFPSSFTPGNIVEFDSNNTISDSGATVSSLENVVETVKLNGTALTPDGNKAVDVTVPITEIQVNSTAVTPVNHVVDITVPAQVNADWNSNSGVSEILNKPSLATVATTGDYTDLSNTPSLATVATTGDYDDLTNKPTIPAAQVNADWNSSSGVSEILNKPTLASVATSGDYSDLSNTPALATVATTGDYDDLSNKPTIPAAQVNSDWNASSGVAEILNKPTLATVATTGDYEDLSNKPTIPAAQVNSDWNASSGVAEILNKPTLATVATTGDYGDLSNAPALATVATSGDYDDLSNKPTIPAAQVNSDWNASSGVAEILNKPTIGDGTLSITVGSASAQTFTANQSANSSVTVPLASVDSSGATPVYTEGLMSSTDKEKLEGIEAGAEVNVKPDWEATAGSDAEILNKPDSVEIVGGTGITVTEDTANHELVIASIVDVSGKADKTVPATANNFAALNSSGNLADSGYSSSSFATAAQGALADSSIQGVTVDSGSPLTPTSGVVNIDLSGKVDKVTGKELSTNDYDNTDKATVTKAAAVIPSDATDSNQLVSYDTMTAALANFIGMKVSNGTGADMHPDEQNPNTKTIYLVYDSSATGGDKYKEWIYSTTNTWTLIGDTTVDLSGYVQYPATHTDTHIVAFGPNDSIADTGKTVADLTNSVETVSIGSGSGISPTSGTTDINIPLATYNNGAGTDGAMAGADKVKLDDIAPGAQVNTVNTISIGSGTAIQPTSGTTDINIPMATSSVDGAMSSADKGKLDGITAGAEPNVQSDWNITDNTSDAYIANKPDIIIPKDSPSAQGGISAPKYLMVVTTMPPSAQIDPDTIYLVQGTYIGT